MRERPGTRLFVKPLHWTSEHLQFLGCQFNLESRERSCKPVGANNSQRDRAGDDEATRGRRGHRADATCPSTSESACMETIVCLLRRSSMRSFKILVIQDLLEHYGFQPRRG